MNTEESVNAIHPTLPSVAVVIVSDENRGGRSWHAEMAAIEAFASQDYGGKVDLILVENERYRFSFPRRLLREVPNLVVHFSAADTSAALKNLGIARSSADLVAVFEADCRPLPDCLSTLVETLVSHPEADMVSARTLYRGADRSMLRRCLSFTGRGRLESNVLAPTRHVSNNALLMRAAVARHFPLPEQGSPFVSAQRRNTVLRQSGKTFMMNPQAIAVHEFEGLRFEIEYRKQKGFQCMQGRPAMSLSGVPVQVVKSSLSLFRHVLSRGARELRPLDLPAALALCLVLPVLEIGGMVDAVRGRATTGARFR